MNISILKMVVAIIGIVEIMCLVIVALLLLNDKTVPDLFQITIASGITGLLGLLAPSREATRQ